MAESRWKRHERRAARTFGAERALQEGREGPDFETDFVVGSVKSRKQLPKWLTEAVEQVRGYAQPLNNKLPILCLVEKDKRGFLVVIHVKDFEAYFGDLVDTTEE